MTRLDATTGDVTGRGRVGRDPKGIAVGAGSVRVVNAGDCSVTRIVHYGIQAATTPPPIRRRRY